MKSSNYGLLKDFESTCFYVANHPNNKSKLKELIRLERKLGELLGLTEEEIKKLGEEG